jgi:hypothetical protein
LQITYILPKVMIDNADLLLGDFDCPSRRPLLRPRGKRTGFARDIGPAGFARDIGKEHDHGDA